jgi:hypothetical protein
VSAAKEAVDEEEIVRWRSWLGILGGVTGKVATDRADEMDVRRLGDWGPKAV